MPAALPFALLGAHLVLVAADGPPKLDIEGTCNSAGRASVSQDASADGCLRSERSADDELRKRWDDFAGDAKRQCSQQSRAGGFPSYVEMLTCLELASGSVPTNSPRKGATAGEGSPATTGSTSGREGGSLTAEPDPSQRTDPLKVLGKPAH